MTISEVRVELNDAGIQEYLKSSEVQAYLLSKATTGAAAARANAGPDAVFIPRVRVGRTRAIASINAVNPAAVRAESRGRALTRAIDAIRG